MDFELPVAECYAPYASREQATSISQPVAAVHPPLESACVVSCNCWIGAAEPAKLGQLCALYRIGLLLKVGVPREIM